MSKRAQRLGRGLEALIGTSGLRRRLSHRSPSKAPSGSPCRRRQAGPAIVQSIPLDLIDPNPVSAAPAVR